MRFARSAKRSPRKFRCPRSASAPTHRLRWSRLRALPFAQDDTDGMLIADHGRTQFAPTGRRVAARFAAQHLLHKQRGYIGLPQAGEGGPSKTVDEDVGSFSMGKRFGVQSFEGVRYSFVDRGCGRSKPLPYRFVRGFEMRRGWRAIPHLAPRAKSPLRVCAIIFNKSRITDDQ